jgi:WD40 repeat protein
VLEPSSSSSSGARRDTIELYELSNAAERSNEIELKLEATDVQWSCSGLTIAASFGRLEHEGSCNHRARVSAWNIARRDFKPDKPTFQIDTGSCIMCLAFHPSRPGVLAGGSFTGEVLLWDLGIPDMPELHRSEIDEYFHRDSVT